MSSRSKQRDRYLGYESETGKAEGTTVLKSALWMYHPLNDDQEVNDPADENNDIIPEWTKKYDIVMSDEPESGTVEKDQHVRYWHQAEFRIITPKSHEIIWSHRLLLTIEGTMNNLVRRALLDDHALTAGVGGTFTLPLVTGAPRFRYKQIGVE